MSAHSPDDIRQAVECIGKFLCSISDLQRAMLGSLLGTLGKSPELWADSATMFADVANRQSSSTAAAIGMPQQPGAAIAMTAAHSPTVGTAPGAAYITFGTNLQCLYAARGMWRDNKPRGMLTTMLGDPVPWHNASGPQFFVSLEQIAALSQDISANGPKMFHSKQIAQWLRRLREAAARAGEAVAVGLNTAGRSGVAATPFEPLVRPQAGKAKMAFERHVMTCLHDVIAFSQESVYAAGTEPGDGRDSQQ